MLKEHDGRYQVSVTITPLDGYYPILTRCLYTSHRTYETFKEMQIQLDKWKAENPESYYLVDDQEIIPYQSPQVSRLLRVYNTGTHQESNLIASQP